MEQYIIRGGKPLKGEVTIGGAKNAALGILAAAIMADETVTIENMPNVRDTNVLLQAIQGIGATVDRVSDNEVKINGIYHIDPFSIHSGLHVVVQNYMSSCLFYLIFKVFSWNGFVIYTIICNALICYLIYKICLLISSNINSLLILTFTNAAASEMKNRIRDGISNI